MSDPIPLHVTLFAPTRERCGIAESSRLLISALNERPEIAEVRVVAPPDTATRGGLLESMKCYPADERLFRELGKQMNSGDIAHIQHQYFFFGGVSPHKCHFNALLDSVTVPVALTVHEIADYRAGGWRQALIEITNRRSFLHPSIRRIMVHTATDVQRLVKLGVPESRISLIPIGITEPLPMPDQAEAKEAMGVAGKRVLMIFGFLAAKKGHHIAVEALKSLPSDVVLLLAGEKHPDDRTDTVEVRINQAAHSAKVEDRVIITGYVADADIPTVMAATDIALAPFTETSGSGSLAHLAAYGVPVVASDIPPHVELLSQAPGSMLLFPSGDSTALAAAVQRLLDSPNESQALRTGAEAFKQERAFPRLASRMVEIYRQTLQS